MTEKAFRLTDEDLMVIARARIAADDLAELFERWFGGCRDDSFWLSAQLVYRVCDETLNSETTADEHDQIVRRLAEERLALERLPSAGVSSSRRTRNRLMAVASIPLA